MATTTGRTPKMKIKKGDLVQVVSGRTQARGGDRGRTGRVLAVFPERGRVLVEGVNRVTKHTKAGTSARGTRTGGIEHVEAPLHVSNVALVDPKTKQPTRTGVRTEVVERDGVARTVRVRVARRSGEDIA